MARSDGVPSTYLGWCLALLRRVAIPSRLNPIITKTIKMIFMINKVQMLTIPKQPYNFY
jgi:hypothetical protein